MCNLLSCHVKGSMVWHENQERKMLPFVTVKFNAKFKICLKKIMRPGKDHREQNTYTMTSNFKKKNTCFHYSKWKSSIEELLPLLKSWTDIYQVDANLSWKHHLGELSKKLARTCGIIFKIINLLPSSTLMWISYAFFGSFLKYGTTIRGQKFNSYVEPVCKLEKKPSDLSVEWFTSSK
jgi:hypothetical protein